jgi:RNA polymerase sigma-54 factor
MEMRIDLRMKQTQQLVMTPKLQQALKLLQVPTLRLEQLIKQEIVANPLLEEVPELQQVREGDSAEEDRDEKQKEEEKLDWEDYFQDRFDMGYPPQEREQREYYEKVPATQQSFYEHLLSQLHLTNLEEPDIEVGEYIIGNLDKNGYLTYPVEEIARSLHIGEEAVERVLKVIQLFDPSGVGARDLKECLLIQLENLDEEEDTVILENAKKIVEEYLGELKKKQYNPIIRGLKLPMNDVKSAVDLISSLQPYPGTLYSTDEVKYVIPDLIVDRVGDEYVVYLNDKNIPRLRINPSYKNLLSRKSLSENTKGYILDKLNSARWLIKTIEQRRQTMLKVMNYIVKAQREFFEKGVPGLKPMILLEVAQAIEMHESTISRVTNDKYVQTPRGVFELKYFFGSSLKTESGKEISTKSVKQKIQGIIQTEDPGKPYSDQKIVEFLEREGLKIARRTVAKYREQLGILPARLRKQY